jgi:hypothetical protein
MRRLYFLFMFALAVLSLPALATDPLDGIVPLAKDDITAVAQLKSMPERHAMLFFGDHAN